MRCALTPSLAKQGRAGEGCSVLPSQSHSSARCACVSLLFRQKEPKPFAPDTRRDDGAVPVPCAPQQDRAGPNSHIHVLKHAGLAPALASGARLALRRKSKRKSKSTATQRKTDYSSSSPTYLLRQGATPISCLHQFRITLSHPTQTRTGRHHPNTYQR